MNNKKEKVVKNQVYEFGQKHIKRTFSILTVVIFALFSTVGCNGQLSQKENSGTKSNTITEINDVLESTSEITDTLKLNQYKDGRKDGLWKIFHENGQLKTEGTYEAGFKEGLHQEWGDNGIKILEGFYVRGIENGLMKWYHERGHLAGEGNMVNGIREGKWIICDIEENGFCIEAYFKNGKRDGIWKINHDDSRDKLWKEQTWENDKIVSEKCWDIEGREIKCEKI